MRTIYPRVMRWETAEPPGADDPQGSPGGDEQDPQETGEEQFGPIAFTREVKDDGRMLILYRRRGAPRDG
jgi:hypothetical protein